MLENVALIIHTLAEDDSHCDILYCGKLINSTITVLAIISESLENLMGGFHAVLTCRHRTTK